ncbi:hypothetical protein SAMN02745166_03147 [Prosthecobacter debontii]|uniref:Uncharacterized protein n=1 Tax=Prosthecobacter debontii TaxID=48467 RepID=A0A1T4YFC5_9BACT|nr:hypothetical protein SAMN02745166_03147 [Prosthecobacter debontii]
MIPILQVLDNHRQKYLKSCSASLVEILLKFHEKVPLDYFELQDQYQNENIGLTHFRDQEIQGLHIHCHSESTGHETQESAGLPYLLTKLSERGNGEGRQTYRHGFPLLGTNPIQ